MSVKAELNFKSLRKVQKSGKEGLTMQFKISLLSLEAELKLYDILLLKKKSQHNAVKPTTTTTTTTTKNPLKLICFSAAR